MDFTVSRSFDDALQKPPPNDDNCGGAGCTDGEHAEAGSDEDGVEESEEAGFAAGDEVGGSEVLAGEGGGGGVDLMFSSSSHLCSAIRRGGQWRRTS